MIKDENSKDESQMEYLGKFLENTNSSINEIKTEIHEMKSQYNESTLEYISVDLSTLPCGDFYPANTSIKIRAAHVNEVQNFSVIDENNPIDATDKMNEMLSSCIKVVLSNGNVGSYKNIKDADRLFLIFMIRELTFQKGNTLVRDFECPHCHKEIKIPYRSTPNQSQPKTFVISEILPELKKFYKPQLKTFRIIINQVEYRLKPPTIGIQEIFFKYIIDKQKDGKKIKTPFLKLIPYLLDDRTTISEDGIKAKEKEFEAMDMQTFQVLNSFVDKMTFGITELKMTCECGNEVRTDFTFPFRTADLFIIPDAFADFDSE
jgi:hypothetical protein